MQNYHNDLRSNLVVDEVTLLTRLGSLVGVGRTLVWILLAGIGAVKFFIALVSFLWTRVNDNIHDNNIMKV